jgi:riboflavin synthase
MFTGIIEDVGTITRVGSGPEGGRVLAVRTAFDPSTLAVGDSIANSGVCLTVTHLEGATFSVDVGPETLARTTLGALTAGSRVNLERSVTLDKRLGGHLVQGHVDAVGRVARIEKRENAFDFEIEAPEEVLRLAIPRGSIAVDGISLTVTGRSNGAFSVSIIPHTLRVTTIHEKKVGDGVNLEADLIARYVAGLLDFKDQKSGGLTEDFLRKHGF